MKEDIVKKTVPEVAVFRKREPVLGKINNLTKAYTVFDETIKIVDGNTGKCLAIFLKGILLNEEGLLDIGRKMTIYQSSSVRRANASGTRKIFSPKNGTMVKKLIHHGEKVPSAIVGYADADNYHPCRQTALYRKHKDIFDKETIKVIQKISKLFSIYCPTEFALQKKFIKSCNQNLVLDKTVYTTLTINDNWQTATHTDKGDFSAGLGNLSVFKYGDYTGGEIMFPAYDIAFNIQEGDVLFMDVHEPHCNNRVKGKGRIGLVCYAREQIKVRCADVTKEQVENPVSYRNREKRAQGPCVNCKSTTSHQWRYTKTEECLCNACGLDYNKKGMIVPRQMKPEVLRKPRQQRKSVIKTKKSAKKA